MYAIQLDFFETEKESEMSAIRKDIRECRQSGDRVRKGTYARINQMENKNLELETRLEIIERYICRGDAA